MKQGFLRSEAFELGEPGQLNMRERRHRRTSRRARAYAYSYQKKPAIFLGGAKTVYILGWVLTVYLFGYSKNR